MNEDTIEFRLDQIESKLDGLTDLLVQTQTQELKITTLSREVQDLKRKMETKTDRWLNPLISTLVSGLVAYMLIRLGVK